MINGPYFDVDCDGCDHVEVVQSSSERGVQRKLVSLGWLLTDEHDYCPDCARKR